MSVKTKAEIKAEIALHIKNAVGNDKIEPSELKGILDDITDSYGEGGGGGGSPTGAAGGHLAGTYPNPTLALGVVESYHLNQESVIEEKLHGGAVTTPKIYDAAVTTPKIAHGAVSEDKIGSNAVTTDKLANEAVTEEKIGIGAVNTDNLVNYAVTTAKIGNLAITTAKIADGSVTEEKLAFTLADTATPIGAAGGDLTGTYPNPTIAESSVTELKIANISISNAKLQNSAITTDKIANNQVTTDKIADNAVNENKLSTGSVIESKLGISAVSTGKIADLAVTRQKIANSAVDDTKIADLSIYAQHINNAAIITAKIQDAAVTLAKLGQSGAVLNDIIQWNGTNWTPATITFPSSLPPSGAAGGDLTGTYPNPTIAESAVTELKIANISISNAKIQNSAITTDKIANNQVTEDKLADGAVTNAKIAAGNITNSKLANDSVGNSKILDGAVTTTKISDAAVTLAKLGQSGAVANDFIKWNGLAWTPVQITLPTTLPPSGAAGGSLSGTYPNPNLSANAVDNNALAANAVTVGKILDANVTTSKIADAAVTLAKLAQNAATTGQTFVWNGTAWTVATPSAAPSGAAGGNLAGTYPNPTIADGATTDGALTIPKALTVGAAGAEGTGIITINKQNTTNLGGGILIRKATNNSVSDWQVEQYAGANGTTNPPRLRIYPASNGESYGVMFTEGGKMILGSGIGNINASTMGYNVIGVASGNTGYMGLLNYSGSGGSPLSSIGMDNTGAIVQTGQTSILNYNSASSMYFATLQFTVPSTGNKSIQIKSAGGGNITVMGTVRSTTGATETTANFAITSNATFAYLDAAFNAAQNGDIQEVTVYDSTNQIFYKVLCLFNLTGNKAIINVHKLN